MATGIVSGGAGFIGSHLCERLLSEGHAIVCVDNLLTGSRENIARLEGKAGFSYIEHDVSSPDLGEVIKNETVEFVFHLASPASPNMNSPRSYIAYPIETLLVNSVGTYNMLQIAKKHSASFLFTSSSEVYGDPAQSPQHETYWGNVNPIGVRSVYDEGKRVGEAYVMAFVRKFALNARVVRIFNTFGPQMQKDDGRVVSNFINQSIANQPLTIYGDGLQTRSFCFVSDMVDGLYKAMFAENSGGEVFNIGNPDERTILQLAELIRQKTNSSSEITHLDLPEDDPKRRKPDISKAKTLLGWEPQVSVEDGLDKTIEYFRSV